MKNCLFLMAGLCYVLSGNTQPWVNTYNPGSDLNVLTGAAQMPDVGFVATGWLSDPITGEQQSFIIRADNEGQAVYEKTYNFNQSENPRGIIAHEDGSLTMFLYSTTAGGASERSLVNIGSTGNVALVNNIYTDVDWLPFEFLKTTDEHYVMAGICFCGVGEAKTVVAKTNLLGDTIWTSLIPTFHNISKLMEGPEGNLWLAGLKEWPDNTTQPVVMKMNPNGGILVEHTFNLNNQGGFRIVDMAFSAGQDSLLLLLEEQFDIFENNYSILIMDRNLDFISSIDYGIFSDRIISDFELLDNDKLILGGTILDENFIYQAWLGVTDFNNGEIEVRTYGEPFEQESGGYLFITPEKRSIIIGHSEGGDDDPQLIFAAIDQLEDPTTSSSDLTGSGENSLIYPNPVSGEAILKLNGYFTGKKDLELTSLDGKLLDRLSFYQQTVEINLRNYPSGIYFYRVLSNKQLISHGRLVKQ